MNWKLLYENNQLNPNNPVHKAWIHHFSEGKELPKPKHVHYVEPPKDEVACSEPEVKEKKGIFSNLFSFFSK